MNTNRRILLKGVGGTLAVPLLESLSVAAPAPTATRTRFLVVGNPFGMHPEHFFPVDFGKDFTISPTLQSLEWLKDRLTIISHTDHNMLAGMGGRFRSLVVCYRRTHKHFQRKICRSISCLLGTSAARSVIRRWGLHSTQESG